MERRSFLKAMAAAVAFPFGFLRTQPVQAALVPGRIRTGWPAFDEALGGGFERNHFVVLKHDASVNENWFLWNLQQHNGPEAAAIWQFEPDPDAYYFPAPGGKRYCSTPHQASHWYRKTYQKVVESNKVIISPHELKTPMPDPAVVVSLPEAYSVGRVCDYYGSVVIRARAMREPGLVKYTITKCRCGPGYRSILVRHKWWFGKLYSQQVEVIDAGESSG